MPDNSFSLIDLYPKYVINSKGEKQKFDENSIAKILNKETGLDIHLAEEVAEDAIRTIVGLGMEEITTNYIRELICVELTQRGLNKYRNLFARAINLESIGFKLDEDFIDRFEGKQPEWGPLGYITYKRTYSRIIEGENRKEDFWETLRRVVEGCYSIQKEHCMKLSLPWSDEKAQKSAQIMFQKIWNFKFSPPGRGLWMMGTEFIARHGSMSLNNCGFASTEDIDLKYSKSFCFVMDSLMLGVGTGFDTKGAGKIMIQKPKEGTYDFVLEDSREGWVDSLRLLLEAFFLGKQIPIFDFSKIRPAGSPIRGFGGIASGSKPLKDMLKDIQKILEARIGQVITSLDILDVMNYIGKCVVAGNVRRCLPKGTLIHTKDGLIPIEKVKAGMLVETTKGLFPVAEVLYQGKQSLIRIKSQIGEFYCTKNHQIAVMTNIGEYSWKKAKDLTNRDRIVFPLHISVGKDTSLPEWTYDKPDHSTTCKDIIIPSLDEDMAWFLGYFHGDGCVMPNFDKNGFNAEINVAIDKNHPLIIKKCNQQLSRFGVDIYSPELEEGCVKLRCISKQLAWYFDHFKQSHKTIIIPEYILQGKKEIRAAYLGGLFDADGSSLTRPIHLVVTIYQEFAIQVKALYASLGIPTKIQKTDRSNIENWEDLYHVNLVGELTIKRFATLIKKYTLKFISKRKTDRSQHDFGFPSEWIIENNFHYGRNWNPQQKQMTIGTYLKCGGNLNNLIPIKVDMVVNNDAKKYDTYDISVEDVHEFIAGDGILVHNSAEIALGDPTDYDFVTCKQDEEALYSHRWASNNSVFAMKGLDYSFLAKQIAVNGEPGIFWLENARAYSRMGDPPDYKDKKAAGVNPCITGDTLIAVADGRNAIPIKELTKEGLDVPVYCKNKHGITTIRMMRNPRITGYNEKIYKVTLDDGSSIKCTDNHEFLMKDGSLKSVIDLKSNDSVMITSKWQTTWSEIMGEDESKKSPYWMLNNGKKNIFEHTLIYEKLTKTSIKPGYIIHHKDRDSLNNNISNLELLLKDIHDNLYDISGDKNPMRSWYPYASTEEKKQYHERMSEATARENNPRYSGFTNKELYKEMLLIIKKTRIPLTIPSWKEHSRNYGYIHNFTKFRGKLINLIKKANIECGFKHYDNPALMREYKKYFKLLEKSDFELIFNDGIWLVKQCELCGIEFHVKYRERERSYCSYECSNKVSALKAGAVMREKGKNQREIARKKLFELFEEYVCDNNEIPKLSDFLSYLNANGVNDFRTAGIYKGYQYVLDLITERYTKKRIIVRSLRKQPYRREMATELISEGLCSNHKVVSVVYIGNEDVFNVTVDDFHNYGIILNKKKTKTGRPKLEMIFTVNCGEQTLESFELCCLVESFPSRHSSYEEFQDTLKYAYLYSKSVTLVNTHWKETNAVMLKNRRMGISQTGIIEAFVKHGRRTILEWSDKAYKYLKDLDEKYSNWLCIPKSIKITTVKPSGTVSLLAGVPPGIHYPHSEYYIRRIRLSKNSDLIEPITSAGYKIEVDSYSPNTVVAEFPIHEKFFERSKTDVSIWEQAENAAAYQKTWSDNQVSITITFKPEEADQIKHVLECYEDKLKSVSFLPIKEHGYKQAPYEEITKEQYEEMTSNLKPLHLDETQDREIGEKFCDTDTCELPPDYFKK